MNEEFYICRTCLMHFDKTETSTDSMESVQLQIETCIPELTLNIVKNYIICKECTESLFFVYNFKKMCLETEEKIYKYILYSHCEETSSVDIKSVMEWYEKHEFQCENGKIKVVPILNSTNENISESVNSNDSMNHHCSVSIVDPRKTAGLCIKTEDFKYDYKEEFDHYGDVSDDCHMIDDDYPINEIGTESSYQKFCEFENQFANYSIDEFYSKGLVKLPECSVRLNRLSADIIKKYARTEKKKKTIECRQCNLPFPNISLKLKHDKELHKKKIKCQMCNYTTISKALLYLHLKSHNPTSPKIYNCSKCCYFSSNEDNLFYHLRQHSLKDLGKPKTLLKCEVCKYNTLDLKKLFKHLKCHTTLHCIECTFETWFRDRLELHYLQVHYIQSPFRCKLCKTVFSERLQLIDHVIAHMLGYLLIQKEHNYALTVSPRSLE